jgi:hypothetical protein
MATRLLPGADRRGLAAAVARRHGYVEALFMVAAIMDDAGGDGGIDIDLNLRWQTLRLQYRHWRGRLVPSVRAAASDLALP